MPWDVRAGQHGDSRVPAGGKKGYVTVNGGAIRGREAWSLWKGSATLTG